MMRDRHAHLPRFLDLIDRLGLAHIDAARKAGVSMETWNCWVNGVVLVPWSVWQMFVLLLQQRNQPAWKFSWSEPPDVAQSTWTT